MWQRWNQSTHIFEKSDNDGASWVPLPLSATILSEGVITRARQDALTAYLDVANIFTLNQQITKTRPEFIALFSAGASKSRFSQPISGALHITQNLGYDGTNWNLDDTGVDGGVLRIGATGILSYFRATAGSNPRTLVTQFQMNSAGYFDLLLGQLKFPATQNASSDANILDDYEEGTFTPTLTGTSGAPTYSAQVGRYQKIGRWVFLQGRVTITAVNALTGIILLNGLPFVADATASNHGGFFMHYWLGFTAAVTHLSAYGSPSTSAANLIYAAAAGQQATTVTQAQLQNNSDFLFSAHYQTST